VQCLPWTNGCSVIEAFKESPYVWWLFRRSYWNEFNFEKGPMYIVAIWEGVEVQKNSLSHVMTQLLPYPFS
jgi:hypothetical protein